jgi:voltage-gated potassium channel
LLRSAPGAGTLASGNDGSGGPMTLKTLRLKVYRQLEPTAWRGKGLSPVNLLLVILIIVAVVEAVLDTEPRISRGRETLMDNIEFGLGIIFLIEYVLRAWIAVDNPRFKSARFPRLRYMMTPIAIIDLLAVVPALFAFGGAQSLILRFFRVLRMLRLAKLGRTSKAWHHIRDAVYERRYEFGLIIGMLAVAILVSASLLYWAEADAQPDKFGSIPRSLWWAIVTLTTVGYGDAYPVTTLGRVLAGFIAVVGVTLIALPTGLFAASFTEAMERQRRRDDEAEADAEVEADADQ